MKKPHIICTIGPASAEALTLHHMAQAGMSVCRLNFSHGTHTLHAKYIDTIRTVNKKYGHNLKILQDLEGYRIRLGKCKDNKPVVLKRGDRVILTNSKSRLSKPGAIPFDYSGSFLNIIPGADIFIDDGTIHLSVIKSTKTGVEARVIVPGLVKSHKGVNIPDVKLEFNLLTGKDKKDILFGIEHRVDFIAQSFVRNQDDMLNVKMFLEKHRYNCRLVAKIENREGINNVKKILRVADGIMIARGDMGVSMPIYEVPVIQKIIISYCNKAKKPVITATQMLESMTHSTRPTRAEVTDVANAVLDGSDCLMLSGETAVGDNPVATVEMMSDIIRFTTRARTKGMLDFKKNK